ncbi:MAG: hypothetical protein MZW92_17385 [Comamonadaceae bacterium]|nr:hypothetical protein [Comamonadaceae bacterium]
MLLLGSTTRGAGLDARRRGAVQPRDRSARCARCSARATRPGRSAPLSATYRFARGLSEQVEVGWQWPLSCRGDGRPRRRGGAASGTPGTRVGRVNYSLTRQPRHRLDRSASSTTPAAGSARVVAERLSTGRSEATTRLLLQLELVGLSRLGSNPLQGLEGQYPRLPPAARRRRARPISLRR